MRERQNRRSALKCLAGVVLVGLVLGSAVCHAGGGTLTGTITIPIITDRPETQPFAPHPGWVDFYAAGDSKAVSGRIGTDGHFEVPELSGTFSVIASFDEMEMHPIILPVWKSRGKGDETPEIPIVINILGPMRSASHPAGIWPRP